MKYINTICGIYILIDWIYTKVKYKEWSAMEARIYVALGIFMAVVLYWK